MAIHACTFCKNEFSVEGKGEYLCPHCHQQQTVVLENVGDATAPQDSPRGTVREVPWENRQRLGWWKAIRETWPLVVLRPREFFSSLRPGGGLRHALLWAVLFGSVGFIANFFLNRALEQLLQRFVEKPQMPLPAGFAGHPLFVAGVLVVLAPIAVVTGVFLQSVLLHGSLVVVGARREGVEATLKVMAYAQAPLLLAVFPVLGTFAAWVGSVVIAVIGCREMHRTTTGKVVLAWLLPMLLCCCALLGLSVMGVAAFLPILKQFLESMPR